MRLLAATFLTTLFLAKAQASFPQLHHRAPASHTESAVQARQLTRERLVMRSEKLTMASLFGRADCSLPEPSTLACTCGPDYTLCGPLCRNTIEDPDFCGDCDTSCPPGVPGERGCCNGGCVDFSDDGANCGSCGTACDGANGEECCGGSCADLDANPEHCGSCGTPCNAAAGATCCDGLCVLTSSFEFDSQNCGACGNPCPAWLMCCDSMCVDTRTDSANCGVCGFVCPELCSEGICQV